MEITIEDLERFEKESRDTAASYHGNEWLKGLYTGEAMGYRIVRMILEKK